MTGTPRTDIQASGGSTVSAYFARHLETELIAAKSRIELTDRMLDKILTERDRQREAHRIAMQRAIRKHAEVEALINRIDDALADMEDIAHGDLGLMVSQARALCRLDFAGGGGAMSLYRERQVKRTRKATRCDWCREWIGAGEPSVITCGLSEGDFFSARYHPECHAAINRYVSLNRCWGEPLPDDPMNRGGIEPRGEEEQP